MEWLGSTQRIDPLQVTDEDGAPGAELVGVVIEDRRFVILHTRPLARDDIVHELLHVAHPDWPHEQIEQWTERLCADPALDAVPGIEDIRRRVTA